MGDGYCVKVGLSWDTEVKIEPPILIKLDATAYILDITATQVRIKYKCIIIY